MRCALARRLYLSANHYARIEVATDEGYDCIVRYRPLQYLNQLGMVHRIEEAFKVDTYRIAIAVTYYLRDTNQCLLDLRHSFRIAIGL